MALLYILSFFLVVAPKIKGFFMEYGKYPVNRYGYTVSEHTTRSAFLAFSIRLRWMFMFLLNNFSCHFSSCGMFP